MSNVSIMTANYNLSALVSVDAINNPAQWLSVFNSQMGNLLIITFLVVVGVIIFMAARRQTNNDTEPLLYAGLIVSFVGTLIFAIKTSDGSKLIEIAYLLPIYLVTAIAAFLNFSNRNF